MSVTPSPIGGFAGQFFDNNGQPLSGGKIYTYAAGTTTPQATYTSALGITPHANPIILDSAGRVPGGEIWLTDGLIYKFKIDTATDILIGTYDNITGVNSNFVNYTIQEEVITATAGQTVFNLSTINYTPGTNSLSVYIDGVNQYVGDSYIETDSDTVTFTAGLHVGAEVKFTTAVAVATGTMLASDVGFTQAGTGAIAQTVQTKLEQYVSVKDFGAVGDGVTNDTAALNAALAVAVANNRCLYLPAGTYLATANIIVPTPSNVQRGFTIIGEGKHSGSVIKFSGAAVTTGLTFTSGVGVYQYWGTISEIQIDCVSGAKRGMTFTYAHAPILSNIQFNGGTEPCLVLDNCNQPVVEKCLFINSGSSGTAQLKMDYCTAFTLSDNYIGQSATAAAGIDIDRTNTGIVIGGAIESTGVPIRICEAADGVVGCNDITLQSINIENPTNCYIRMGYGWTSTFGVRNIVVSNCRGYTSGSVTALIGVDMKHCLGVDIISCQFALNAGGTASHNLNGTTNLGIFVGKNRESFGTSIPWVMANSAAVAAATPITDWSSDFVPNQTIYVFRSPTTNTLNNVVFAGQGGLYSYILLGNSGATTINRTSAVPNLDGTTLTLVASDANTTIAHLGGGGSGQFRNLSGANITMASGQALSYVWDNNFGTWSQI